MKARRRSSDSSLPVRFSGTEHGRSHARWYRTIAEHYDRMYDPERATRADAFLRHLFLRHAVGREVLDVACGTFAIDVPLVKRGYHVAGRDRSEEMLRVARRNLRTAGVTADVGRADMRSLRLGRRFDAVLCLGTAFNYLASSADASKALQTFRDQIRPGGVLVLDLTNFEALIQRPKNVRAEVDYQSVDGTKIAIFAFNEQDVRRIIHGVSCCARALATRVVYMEERRGQEPDPCYAREFDARILERGPDFVVLDQTLFYAEGGGQPDDTGTLRWKDGEARVLRVTKEKGVVKHHVDRMPSADGVHGVIDWDRRYKHMRMHTSQHLMSGLVFRTYGARTVGNQIHMDYSRVDFQPANFTPEDLKRIGDDCNRVIASSQAVRIFEEDRVVVHDKIEDRALLDLIPQSVRRLRIIEIGSADYCPCGGTHLKNVSEIVTVHI